ncbi:spermidine/putrescine ABC transporter substrate-binding protein [Cyanobacteria bacterium FACHB-471]|nr:spermidine/putrescine ABC transporter substrate-binding protein [Cyanobacteria bacterium FACHB-471]
MNTRKPRFYPGRSPRIASTRRGFLQLSAAALSGAVLSNCARNLADVNSEEPAASSAASDGGTLHVYSWANYTDQELLDSFKAKTGVEVVVDTYDSNETMLAKMQAGGGSAYSIIFPSDYMVSEMIGLDMLTPLDKSRLVGLENLRSQWQDPVYDPGSAHSIAATWGTTGFIYNPANLGTTLTGWDYFWENGGSLDRKITLLNDVREVMGGVLHSLGYSYNSEDPAELEEAYNRLVELKPAIASFITNGWEDQVASGDLLVSMAYSVDAIALIEENPDLEYVIPETGSSLWTDTMVIPKSAPNLDAAYEWLNFLLVPENAASLVERLKFATPNKTAYEQLSAETKADTKLFPPQDLLDRCEGIAPVSEEATELYDQYWTQLTSS